jgi:hypothetical protein
MIEIKLVPTYEPWRTRETQIDKIEEEQQEVLEADNWQDRCHELLDLAQTVVGYKDMVRSIPVDVSYVNNTSFSVGKLNLSYRFFHSRVKRFDDVHINIIVCNYFIGEVLDMFYGLICANDRGNKNHRRELVDRFLQEHEEKLARRRKEWSNENA